MFKKIKFALTLGAIAMIATVAACAKATVVDDYKNDGYAVTVTYEAGGGKFIGRDSIVIMDMFRPSDYEKNADGAVSIKLTEPTSPLRKSGSSDAITLSLSNHFFVGWYKEREVLTDENGNVFDENGNKLSLLDDGSYVIEGTSAFAVPQYTYSGRWDFENDRIYYKESDGEIHLTLYPAWVKYFQFDYFAKNEDGEWQSIGQTSFNYKAANENGNEYDKDTVFLPDWKDGAMNYTYNYADKSIYRFPKVEGTTFVAAYTDRENEQRIDGSYEHTGTIDLESGRAVNPVNEIFVELEKGERFKISTAKQLADNGNPAGIYEILNDLDFEGETWPFQLSSGRFTGKMIGVKSEGGNPVIKNVTVSVNGNDYGGLFGAISSSAQVKDVTFENATLDIDSTDRKAENALFGLLAGEIENGAEVSGVKIDGNLKIGCIVPLENGRSYKINLLCNGDFDKTSVERGEIGLSVYAEKSRTRNYYYVDPQKVTVDKDGNVDIVVFDNKQYRNADKTEYDLDYYDINY